MPLEITNKLLELKPELTVRDMIIIYLKRRMYKINKEDVPAIEKEINSLEYHKGMFTRYEQYKYFDEAGESVELEGIDNLIILSKKKIRRLEIFKRKLMVFLEELMKENRQQRSENA